MCSLGVSKHLSVFLKRVTGCPSVVFSEVGMKGSFSYKRKLELQLNLKNCLQTTISAVGDICITFVIHFILDDIFVT